MVAATANGGNGYVPTREITAMLEPRGWTSTRSITRLIAQLADRGLVFIRDNPADRRIREIAASDVALDFYAAWHDAHLTPLGLLAMPTHCVGGDRRTTAVWKAIVIGMKRDHDFVLVDPFPQIGTLMRRANGYLSMLALRLDPGIPARRIAIQFGRSETQARKTRAMANALDPALVDRWIATELGFAAIVAEQCAGHTACPGKVLTDGLQCC